MTLEELNTKSWAELRSVANQLGVFDKSLNREQLTQAIAAKAESEHVEIPAHDSAPEMATDGATDENAEAQAQAAPESNTTEEQQTTSTSEAVPTNESTQSDPPSDDQNKEEEVPVGPVSTVPSGFYLFLRNFIKSLGGRTPKNANEAKECVEELQAEDDLEDALTRAETVLVDFDASQGVSQPFVVHSADGKVTLEVSIDGVGSLTFYAEPNRNVRGNMSNSGDRTISGISMFEFATFLKASLDLAETGFRQAETHEAVKAEQAAQKAVEMEEFAERSKQLMDKLTELGDSFGLQGLPEDVLPYKIAEALGVEFRTQKLDAQGNPVLDRYDQPVYEGVIPWDEVTTLVLERSNGNATGDES